MPFNDDDELITRSMAGDNAAFEALVKKYQDRVYNICRYMLGAADAEDAAQDAFVKAYRHLDRFTPSPSFKAWITRIAVNSCLDYKRKPAHVSLAMTSREGDEYTLEPQSDSPGPEAALESKKAGEAISAALTGLSEKLRAVIVLYEIEGLSYEEISETLGISIGTVKSRISRAREELKRLLRSQMEQIS
ncbi:MAG: sigma-70 family RNA polymerase sigma factor [Deltaproteobacteria bacterium]|nr:sigma-70 family RNA polymerase sigma factor [Deltaproteobacteria bacterium]MBZ0218860.1 sigma-70 family RNA polymerase sigma factor [Deltaproteobacteria bacterium]